MGLSPQKLARPLWSLLVLVWLGGWQAASAAEHPILAVFDIEERGVGILPAVLVSMTDILGVKLAECGYQVVPRAQLRERLVQQKAESYRECYDESCQVELGRELAAQKALSTKLVRVGKTCQVMASLFDLEKAAAETAAAAEAPCEDEAGLLSALRLVAGELCQPLATDADELTREAEFLAEANRWRAERERAAKAWETVTRIIADTRRTKQSKIEILQKFLEAFPERNPRRLEAWNLLRLWLPCRLVVRTEPPGAQVLIDDKPIGREPLSTTILAGELVLNARQQDMVGIEQLVTLRPGEKTEVVIRLRPENPGGVSVVTRPAGAMVHIDGVPGGPGPFQKALMPGAHRASASLSEHEDAAADFTVRADIETEVVLELARIYPMNPYKVWGHASFWSGVGLGALGAIATWQAAQSADDYGGGDLDAADRNRAWKGVMYASYGLGGALAATGVILWALSPGDKEWALRDVDPTFAVTPEGAQVGLRGRF